MISYLRNDRISYFQSYKNYFIAIYLAFLGFPCGDLVILSYPHPLLLRLASQVFVTSGSMIAIIWGYVATRLYMYPEPLSLRRLVSRPLRPIFLIYAVYLVPMLMAPILAWSDPTAILTGQPFQSTYLLEGISLPSAPVGDNLLAVGGAIVFAFTSYPLAVLSRRRALVKDKEVRAALRVIASVFGVISATLIMGIGISSFGYSITSITNFLSVILIIVAVRAFRKPTFLKSFLGVVPSLQSSPTASRYDQMMLMHGPGDEKFGPIAKYIVDGVNQRERVIYFHDGDVAEVTEGLARQGVDVTRLTLKGALRVSPLGTAYPSRSNIDDTPIEVIQELANEAKTLGNEGLRVVLDYDDFVVRPLQKFVNHLTDPRWTSPDHRLHILIAFDSLAFRGEEASLAELESKIRTLDLSEARDTFSRTVGLSHDEIAGKKLLLEFDPQSDYERVFRSLFAETASNFERTVVFTRKDSSIYSIVQSQPAAKIFVLTSRVSYPKMSGENLFLLPTYDSSLFLDSLNKTIEAYTGTSFTIVFDNITHLIFTIGPERTYSLVRQALELMISDKITAIFSMNFKAHDQKTLSSFETMFDIELICKTGSLTPEIRKKVSIDSY
jgi:hypothetical protein